MKKRALAISLVFLMIISMFPLTALASEFSDMPNNWATEALENAVTNGLLKGDGGNIMPDENLTRAQMATIVNRAFNATDKSSISNFTDVQADTWYHDEMAKAVKMKTFFGTGDKLNPNNSITREEAFTVLARAFKLSGAKNNVLDKFSDKSLVSDWTNDGVSSLVSKGYVAGSNGQLNPKQFITRAEFAQIMDNLLKNYVKTAGTYTTDFIGNVMVNVTNVTFKDLTINGDLIIGDGVGDGTVTLDGVTVTGRTVIRGGGENSIKIIGNSKIKSIIIARVDGVVRVYSEDGTEIGEVIVDGNDDVIIEGSFKTITVIASTVTVIATNATIESASVEGENSKIIVEKNSAINTINVTGQGTTIEGDGAVESVQANANDVTVNTLNTKVTAGEEVIGVKAGGTPVDPGKTETVKPEATPPGGGGGGGFNDPAVPDPSEPSTYKFNYVVPIDIVAGEDVEVDVIFGTDTKGDHGYDGVRFEFEIKSAPASATVTFSSADGQVSRLVLGKGGKGYWGPGTGFNVPANYTATTGWILNFSEEGTYEIAFSLIDAVGGDIIANITDTATVTVNVIKGLISNVLNITITVE